MALKVIILFPQTLPRLASLAVESVSSFSVDFFLQTRVYQAGALWPLLLNLFSYDFTLEESGVQASQETNQQHVANSLAKLSLLALGRLGGYSAGGDVDGTKQNGVAPEPPPENPAVRKSLAAMLTPYIARKLGTSSPAEVGTKEIRLIYVIIIIIFVS